MFFLNVVIVVCCVPAIIISTAIFLPPGGAYNAPTMHICTRYKTESECNGAILSSREPRFVDALTITYPNGSTFTGAHSW